MTEFEIEESKITNLEVVAHPVDLRRDIHEFAAYVRSHEIKRGHRDNQIPAAHRQRLIRLLSGPPGASPSDEIGRPSWIEHVDEVCFALKFIRYDTKGIYAGYSSSSASFPDNYIQFDAEQYEKFSSLPLRDQEARLLGLHLQNSGEASEFFSRGPLSQLNTFDRWGCATGMVPMIPFPKVRRYLLELLANCPCGVWLSTKSLIDHLRRHAPWFLIPETVPAAARASAARSGRYANFSEQKTGEWSRGNVIADDDPEGFAKVEGRFVERFLEGLPLVLGYVEVAYAKGKSGSGIEPSRGLLPAFRVTERLRSAIRGEIADPKVTVLPNFEVHVESLFYPARIEAKLLPLGELTQRGIVTIVKLTKPKVAAVMAANPRINVAENLKELSGSNLPANVEQELDEWAGHSDKFILYEGFGLLEGAREKMRTDRFEVEAISPNFALVRSPETLYECLEAAEQVPLRIQHPPNTLAAPAGVRSRLAPRAAPARAAKTPAKLRRSVQTTLWFPNSESHAAFRKILLDAKCVVPSNPAALTISYSKKAEPQVKECLKKFSEQFAVGIEDIDH